MTRILITGGTGCLGRPTVDLLRSAGRDIRVLSRTPGTDHVVADLSTGAGLAPALDGVDTVLHLATTRKSDADQTRRLLDASRAAGVTHFVYISIVGVDAIPFPYYVDKLKCERLVEESGVPFTILRATQFHDFIAAFLRIKLPVMLALDVSDQPIAVEEVAARLVELADAAPAGRVPDLGGPQQLTLRELAGEWQRAHGTRKPVWMLWLPGRTIAAFKRGHHMTPQPGYGTRTFAEFAAKDAAK